jgi:hypothetical protein
MSERLRRAPLDTRRITLNQLIVDYDRGAGLAKLRCI